MPGSIAPIQLQDTVQVLLGDDKMSGQGTPRFVELPLHHEFPSAHPALSSASLARNAPQSTASVYSQSWQPLAENTPKTNAALSISAFSRSLQISQTTTPKVPPPADFQAVTQHPQPASLTQSSPRPVAFPSSAASSTSYTYTSPVSNSAYNISTHAPPATCLITQASSIRTLSSPTPTPSLASSDPPQPQALAAFPYYQRTQPHPITLPAAPFMKELHARENQKIAHWTVQGFPQKPTWPHDDDVGDDEVNSAPPAHCIGLMPRPLSPACSSASDFSPFNTVQKAAVDDPANYTTAPAAGNPLHRLPPSTAFAAGPVIDAHQLLLLPTSPPPPPPLEMPHWSTAQWSYKTQPRRQRDGYGDGEDNNHAAACGLGGPLPVAKYARQLPSWRQETSFDWGLPLITEDDDDDCILEGLGDADGRVAAAAAANEGCGAAECGATSRGHAALEARIMEQMAHLNQIAWTGGRRQLPSTDSATATRVALVLKVWQQTTEQAARQLQRYPLSLQHRSFLT